MGIIEDALTDFIVNHFEGELDKVEELQNELKNLRSNVEDLEQKVDELLDDPQKDGKTDSTSEEEGTTQKRVSSRTLKNLRDRLDLTQKELAELLDVSSVTISSWESGNTKPQKENKENIVELREKSKAEVEDMLEREEEDDGQEEPALDVRSVRDKHGLTQEEFAEVLGVTATTVSNWEQGETTPSEERIEEMQTLDGLSEEEEEETGTSISGDEIKQIRSERDLSQSELAEQLGVSAGTVSNWERGKSRPESDKLDQLQDLAEQERTDEDESDGAFSAEDLKTFRDEHDLSQAELADELGVSAGTISNWERGKGTVSDSAREKLKDL